MGAIKKLNKIYESILLNIIDKCIPKNEKELTLINIFLDVLIMFSKILLVMNL